MFIEDLTEIDYRILEFINKNEPIKIEDIKAHFYDIDSLEYRIKILSTPEYKQTSYTNIPIKNSYFIAEEYEETVNSYGLTSYNYLQIYNLTDMGKKALQDYKTHTDKEKKELWLKNAWIPILVSVVTTLIVNWLPTMLLWIQQWFASLQ